MYESLIGFLKEFLRSLVAKNRCLREGLLKYVKEASKNFVCRKYQFNFESLKKIACFRKHDPV
jgi:hypothetical protein